VPAQLLATRATGVILVAASLSCRNLIRIGEAKAASQTVSGVSHPGYDGEFDARVCLAEGEVSEHAKSEEVFADTRQAGYATGRNLAGVGLSVNLAPILDVARQPGNFIDEYERSYGSNPLLAGELGQSFVAAQHAAGVAATAKHFPGLGTASRTENTDERAVVLDIPQRELRAVDEAPYGQAIAAGVRLVMLSWAIYPALDPALPAGLSPTIIGKELRVRLGFRGVTITDSLEAGALSGFGNTARRGVLAAAGGADLVLCAARTVNANTPGIGVAALHGISAAIASGQISRTSAEQAAARVIALRRHS
jgi:beta-N-acetylhexosaminidase